MTHLLSGLYMRGTLDQRSSVGDLPPAVTPAGIAFPLLLLTAQVLPKNSTLGLVGINAQVNRFMADGQLARNLLWAPLKLKQQTSLLMHPHRQRAGIATILCSIGRLLASLLGAVAPRAAVATHLPVDGGLVTVQQFSNLRLIMSGIHERVKMISFGLAEVFVGHKQLRQSG
jgi:hypothetical protein